MKIAITTSSFARYSDEPLKLLEQAGVEYVMNDKGRALTEEEAIQMLEGCHGVAAGTEPLTKKVMDALPDLKVISRCGTGMDNVDRAYAAEKGIAVRNTPDGPTLAVAELTLGLILTLLRQVPHQDRELRSGVWKKRMGNLLHGKNVGIVGFGKIGRTVAHLLEPFGVNIGYHDPFADVPGYTRLELDDLMGWADIITLHCPKTENGAPLLDLGRLSLIRSSVTPPEAKERLMQRFGLSEVQAQAILDMRLQRLTGLERGKIEEEQRELLSKIAWYQSILGDASVLWGVIRDEVEYIKQTYSTPRRTEVIREALSNIDIEDLLPDDDVVITLSRPAGR